VKAAIRLEHGDCLEVMKRLHAEGVRVHSAVTDAPYHLTSIVDRLGSPNSAPIQSGATGVYARSSSGFMGQKWDGGDIAFRPETWRLVFDLLHPGGHLIAFSHCRTYHRMACAIEDAGFEIRNMIDWMYGTGFPKSHNLDGEFDGWGTDLKPAKEPIVLARKPIIGSVAANMAMFGTGALNIDRCRIHADDARGGTYTVRRLAPGATVNATDNWKENEVYHGEAKPGRWPANVVHDGSAEVLDAFAEFGERGAAAPVHRRNGDKFRNTYGAFKGDVDEEGSTFQGDSGTAARFFYSAKATDGERVYRCTSCGAHQLGKPKCGHDTLTSHPTVKPIALMRWLCRLVTPPEGVVLDCFAGTGTTGTAAVVEGLSALLIEREDDYVADIRVRCGDSISERATGRAVRQLDAGPLFDPA
jgi:site-specific DNA-methyltransferase (adenine-specific)